MTTLRKSCRNCTAAKRKCVVQWPKCTRCVQRGLDCVYDLEPLNAPTVDPGQPPRLLFNPSNCDSPGYCIMKTLNFRASHIDPAICQPGHVDVFEIIRLGYISVPVVLRANKPAVFVHPRLQMHGCYSHISPLMESEDGGVRYENFEHLIQLNFDMVPVNEALTAIQALLVYISTFFFSVNHLEHANAEKALITLSEWTQQLMTSVQTRIPENQSSWQKWLFGESVRRTVFMSYLLSLALTSFKHGYCSNWLFVESLPFEKRVGLWIAESPQAWISAARARTGEEVGVQLSSFHQFAEWIRDSDTNISGDPFLTLVVFAHNGAVRKGRFGPSRN